MSNQIRLYKIYCSVTPKFLDSTPISTVEILLSGFHKHRHIPGRQRHSLTAAILLPRWLSSKESAFQCRRLNFNPWVGKTPWRRKWQPTSVFLPGESQGQRSLAGYSPQRVSKESDTTRQLNNTNLTPKEYRLKPY